MSQIDTAIFENYFEQIKAYLIDHGFESSNSVQGLEEDEITDLETRFKTKFPLAYKSWLKVMGRNLSTTVWDHTHEIPMGRDDLIATQSAIAEYTELLGDLISGKLYFSYYPEGSAFHYMDLKNENPPVYLFHGSDQLDEDSFDFIASSFLGYIRESIIIKIKQFPKKFSYIDWVKHDLWEKSLRIDGYRERRSSFMRFIEAGESNNHHFLLPDEFQELWVQQLR